MSRRAWLTRRSVRGVTLLELLVVIGIILAITAAVIPVMAPAMAGRRLREASRGVNTFISSARNKALATGRSVGVAFERLEAEPQASTVLSLVEVPPPWSGDSEASGMVVGRNGRILGFGVRTATGIVPSSELGWQIARVRPGDVVKLNNRNTSYRLYAGEVVRDVDGDNSIEAGEWIDSDVDGSGNFAPSGSYDGDNSAVDPQLGHFIKDPSQSIWTLGYDDPRTRLQPPRLQPGLYSFQIIRQPVRSSAATFQLPVGTVVDLAVSGDDSFSHDRFARAALPNEDPEKRPVVILFAPNGSLDRVWRPVHGTQNIEEFRPTSGVMFLVGRRDGVGLGPQSIANTPVDELPNWRDLDNIWVSVNSQSGMVLSNPMAQVDTLLQVRTSSDTADDTNLDAGQLALGLGQARAFARQGQSMGGR
jgi:type II secretory pathway pseudopilin PulG